MENTDLTPDMVAAQAAEAVPSTAGTEAVASETLTSTTVTVAEIVRHDPRAAHFIVDILAGIGSDEALSRHFAGAPPGNDALDEAEQRGYMRGLNEAAEARMKAPALYETPDGGGDGATGKSGPHPVFLSHTRKSIWD